MNFVRSRLSTGAPLGRRISQTWSQRGMCLKPQETPSEASFKVTGHRPSEMDKRMLLWSGRFKSADQIPQFVSFEMIDAAKTKVRVKACYGMIVATLAGCLLMVIQGKRAVQRHESLTGQNMEKKAKWKEEAMKERDSTAALAQKPQ